MEGEEDRMKGGGEWVKFEGFDGAEGCLLSHCQIIPRLSEEKIHLLVETSLNDHDHSSQVL